MTSMCPEPWDSEGTLGLRAESAALGQGERSKFVLFIPFTSLKRSTNQNKCFSGSHEEEWAWGGLPSLGRFGIPGTVVRANLRPETARRVWPGRQSPSQRAPEQRGGKGRTGPSCQVAPPVQAEQGPGWSPATRAWRLIPEAPGQVSGGAPEPETDTQIHVL